MGLCLTSTGSTNIAVQQLLGCATDREVCSKMKSTTKLVRLALTMSKVKLSTMTTCCGDCIVSRHQCRRAEYSLTCTYSPTLACSFTYHINDMNLRIDTGTFTLLLRQPLRACHKTPKYGKMTSLANDNVDNNFDSQRAGYKHLYGCFTRCPRKCSHVKKIG
jgi:hypothetical protein